MICTMVIKTPCVNRVGKVLTQEEVEHPELVRDNEFCQYKRGANCEHTKS